ncbi:MAG: TraM recognition domain-containing protein [Nitrospirota bacterium]
MMRGNGRPGHGGSDPLATLKELGAQLPLTLGKTDRTALGFGVNLDDPDQEGFISIRDAERSGHFGCFGTTRVGKTRLVENIIEQDIAKGYSVIVFDPKGDAELFSRMVQVAAQTGRLDDLMMLTPVFPDYSVQINPLASYYMQDELVNHIVSGIKAKEDYFIAIATEVSQVVVAGLILIARKNGRPPNLSFESIKERISYEDLKKLRDELAMYRPESDRICASIDAITGTISTADFFGKVSSSLRTMLSALTFGATGQVIGYAQENELIARLESGRPAIVFVNTGSMLTRRTSHIIGKVLLSMIQSLVGRVFASGRKLTPPLCLHLDEGHNLLYQDIQELFSKGGGANCWVHFYSQSMAQIEEAIGPAAAQSVMDNINTWVYMLVNHPDTAKYVEQSSPQVKRRKGVVALGGGVTSQSTEVPQIQAFQVLQLPKRWFYLRSYGRLFKGRTLDTNPLWVRVRFPRLDAQERAEPTEDQAGTEQGDGRG